MNALEELKNIINLDNIKCANIIKDAGYYYNGYYNDKGEWVEKPIPEEDKAVLKVYHSTEDFKEFINKLSNIDYDNGFGIQELYGTIWMQDDTWLEREEYDGSEWWKHRNIPEIPEELI